MNEQQSLLSRFIMGIRALNVPRIEDLPYYSSPPIQFVYQSTAPLALGAYTWADAPTALTPTRPMLDNALYYLRHITLSADVSELDFTAAITTTPEFFTYQKSDAVTLLFREPIQMVKFLEAFDFRQTFVVKQGRPDPLAGAGALGERILAAFTGVLVQTAALIGKTSITLTAVISAQEIVDRNFINNYRAAYPVPVISSTADRIREGGDL